MKIHTTVLHVWRGIIHTVLLAVSYFGYTLAVDWGISSSHSFWLESYCSTRQHHILCFLSMHFVKSNIMVQQPFVKDLFPFVFSVSWIEAPGRGNVQMTDVCPCVPRDSRWPLSKIGKWYLSLMYLPLLKISAVPFGWTQSTSWSRPTFRCFSWEFDGEFHFQKSERRDGKHRRHCRPCL